MDLVHAAQTLGPQLRLEALVAGITFVVALLMAATIGQAHRARRGS